MKRLILVALIASACGSPPEVDEVTGALTIANPWPTTAQWIFVGYRVDIQQTGTLFQNRSTGACSWYPMSPGYGNGSAPTQHYTINGSSQADFMAHVQGSYYAGCGVGYLEWPSQDNGKVIDLYGGAGNDQIDCGGSAGVSNVCNGDAGDDVIYVESYHAQAIGGEGNDKFGIIDSPVSNVIIWGLGGNDCVTWPATGVAGPSGDGGNGTDKIKSRALSPYSQHYEADDATACGGIL